MILGGTGGMCRTGEGGSVPGWRETFLQGIAIASSDLNAETTVVYSASVRIKDSSDGWVTIDAVTSLTTGNSEEGNATASLVIAGVETWGTRSDAHTDLLSPSDRTLQISITATVGGDSASFVVFVGSVQTYSENVASGSDSINIVCKSLMQRISETGRKDVVAEDKTKFRELLEQAESFDIPGPILAFEEDQEQETSFSFYKFPQLPKIFYTWNSAVIGFGAGVIIGKKKDISQSVSTTLSDDNIATASRSVSEASFNTVRCMAHGGGAYLRSEVTDAADVSKRGKIHAPKLLYSYESTIAEVETEAALAISDQLLGKITAQIRLNPFLMPGSKITFSSDRMGVVGSGYIISTAHTLGAGNANTTVVMRVELAT